MAVRVIVGGGGDQASVVVVFDETGMTVFGRISGPMDMDARGARENQRNAGSQDDDANGGHSP